MCVWQFQRIRRLSAQGHDSNDAASMHCHAIPCQPSPALLCSALPCPALLCPRIDFAYKLKFSNARWLVYVIELSARYASQIVTALHRAWLSAANMCVLFVCFCCIYALSSARANKCFDLLNLRCAALLQFLFSGHFIYLKGLSLLHGYMPYIVRFIHTYTRAQVSQLRANYLHLL